MSSRERVIQPSLQILADAPGRAPPDSGPCGKMQRQRPHPTFLHHARSPHPAWRVSSNTSATNLSRKKNKIKSNDSEIVGVDEGDRNPERERPLSHLPDEDEDQSALPTSV